MPELPEVETVKNGLIPFLKGRRCVQADIRRADLRVPFPPMLSERLKDATFTAITRRAKYLILHMDRGMFLIIHLGMSGQIKCFAAVSEYNAQKHDHMVLYLDNGGMVAFNDARRFGMVLLLNKDELQTHPAFASIGPEPLEPSFDDKLLIQQLKGRKTAIKQALLDQHVVAGVGNIYASEALHEAGIAPTREAGSLKPAEAARLTKAIKNVLTRAIESGGSSLKDFIKTDGKPGYFQHSFSVYDREGQPCPVCPKNGKKKTIIQKTVQGGRATYYCGSCQK